MFPKPLPKELDRRERNREIAAWVREFRRQILERDRYMCRCCNGKDRIDVHEHKRRGAGGRRTSENSFALCRVCHALVQTRHVRPEMTDGLRTFDANLPIRFVVPRDVADRLFPRYVPPQVTVEG